MANMVTSASFAKNQKQILIGQDSYFISLPVRVSGTANTILKAGQPIAGNITDRNTAFTASETANGILLHDVKLDADGNGNGTLVLAACVDLLKLEEDIQSAVAVATGLDRIIFVKGSAI